MNLATGTLTFVGMLLLVGGVVSKLMGLSLMAPFISSYMGYFVGANLCFILVLVIDKYQKN